MRGSGVTEYPVSQRLKHARTAPCFFVINLEKEYKHGLWDDRQN